MNENGAFIATLLDTSRKAFAAGAVLRMQESDPGVAALVEELGFQALVEDTQLRLQSLSEALAVGRPELLAREVEWLSATHSARGLTPELLRSNLACLEQELVESLPEDAGAEAARFLQAASSQLGQAPTPPSSELDGHSPHAELAGKFLLAALHGKRGESERLISEALDSGVSIRELHRDVITKAQFEIGRLWQMGEVHVAEEHLSSRIVEDTLALLRGRMQRQPLVQRSVLAASVAGNLHDIGLRIVADHFEMNGWQSIYLGANMPSEELVRAVQDFTPDLIALSAGTGTNVRAVATTIATIRAAGRKTPILVGGRPFSTIPDLWKDVGADGCASDADSAVATGSDLVAL